MPIVSGALMVVGLVVALVGSVMFLVNAFKASVAWGLGCLFLAPIGLVFLFKNWQENKKSFFIQLAGCALMVVAVVLAAPGATQ